MSCRAADVCHPRFLPRRRGVSTLPRGRRLVVDQYVAIVYREGTRQPLRLTRCLEPLGRIGTDRFLPQEKPKETPRRGQLAAERRRLAVATQFHKPRPNVLGPHLLGRLARVIEQLTNVASRRRAACAERNLRSDPEVQVEIERSQRDSLTAVRLAICTAKEARGPRALARPTSGHPLLFEATA